MPVINLIAFAAAKDYFKSEFKIESEAKDISGLKKELIKLNPDSEQLLNACRFAVDQEFVNNDRILKENEQVCIIPPSSGG